ncbi:hypothetical protein ACIA5C_47105 [Actinoplanes sp. NPDC051343]|uniref:hypothetical protein n=1 Tax=Actinoplanes sp. NPDC051343 TaxID=3363906 RepID=UPI003794E159
MDDDQVEQELRNFAGSRTLADELKRNLEKLRDYGGDSPLAEMARGVLEGRMTLREVTRSAAFAVPLSAAMDRFGEYDAQLSEEQRAQMLRQAEERLAHGE